jgi:hypothetical protein
MPRFKLLLLYIGQLTVLYNLLVVPIEETPTLFYHTFYYIQFYYNYYYDIDLY